MPISPNLVINNDAFDDAVRRIFNVLGVSNENEYDGLIIKNLPDSEIYNPIGKSHQTHIAVTGDRMDIFPAVMAHNYHDVAKEARANDFKRYFTLLVDVRFYLDNMSQFSKNIVDNGFFAGAASKEVTLSVCRSVRGDGSSQIELMAKRDEGFREIWQSMHVQDAFVFLKLKGRLKYDCYCMKAEQLQMQEIKQLTGKFFVKKEVTTVSSSNFETETEILNDNRLTGGTNILYYGVPGSGKSYTVDKFCKDNLSDNQYMRRVVFHPDYTYSDFVGQILPTLELDEADNTEKLRYMFTPGPFTKILKIAYENPTENCVLVIEELNRGNAPAIFGEIFQLLDREEDVTSPIFGRSKYGINNTDIANEVFGNKNKLIYLPSNLSIIATMNTSDQNVFTLDTAFQRRWEMEYIPNVFEGAHADTKIVGSNITWKAFAETVNDIISRNSFNMGSTEDKGLGAYFAIGKDLEDKKGFAEKVLKYLWDDAVKLDRKRLFNADLFSLPSMFNAFNNGGLEAVLQSTVYERMLNESKAVVEPASDSVDEISDETGENV